MTELNEKNSNNEKEELRDLRLQGKFDLRYAFREEMLLHRRAILWFIALVMGSVILGALYSLLHLTHV